MNNSIDKLLEQAEIIIESQRKEIKNSESEFNIFKITGIATDEVKVCRMLAEIIKPNGTHNRGTFFLSSFLKKVLFLHISDDEINQTRVYVEYHTEFDRRIDIAIITPNRFIPIEVKIYAADQPRQCRDYYDFALAQHKPEKSKVYYLTLDGHLPQKDGTIGLTPIKENNAVIGYKEIISLSFGDDICEWLLWCLEQKEVFENQILNLNLQQFTDVLEIISGRMDRKMKDNISKCIGNSKQNFEAATAIANSIENAKQNMLLKLFAALEEGIRNKNLPFEQLNNRFDYKYNDYESIKKFYKREKTYPALTYRYKKIDETKEIWFRIEVSYNLYCGFVVVENGENPGKLVMSQDEIKQFINPTNGFSEDSWWFYWEYLLNDDKTMTPNFVNNNEVLAELFDEDKFAIFVKACIERIKILLEDTKL